MPELTPLQHHLRTSVQDAFNAARAHSLLVAGRQSLYLTNARTGQFNDTFKVPLIHSSILETLTEHGLEQVIGASSEDDTLTVRITALSTRSHLPTHRDYSLRYTNDWMTMISKVIASQLKIEAISIAPQENGSLVFTPQRPNFDVLARFLESTFTKDLFKISLTAGRITVEAL